MKMKMKMKNKMKMKSLFPEKSNYLHAKKSIWKINKTNQFKACANRPSDLLRKLIESQFGRAAQQCAI